MWEKYLPSSRSHESTLVRAFAHRVPLQCRVRPQPVPWGARQTRDRTHSAMRRRIVEEASVPPELFAHKKAAGCVIRRVANLTSMGSYLNWLKGNRQAWLKRSRLHRLRTYWGKMTGSPGPQDVLSKLSPEEREWISRIRSQRLTYLSEKKLASLASTCRAIEDA